MTYGISVDRVLESIYAACAVDFFTARQERPAVLGRDSEAALRRLTINAAAGLILKLSPYAVATGLLDEPDADIITIEFDTEGLPGDTGAMRSALEAALAATVMAVAWSGNCATMAESYGRLAERYVKDITTTLRGSSKPGRIAAGYY